MLNTLVRETETRMLAKWLLDEFDAERMEWERECHAVKAAADWRCERCRRQCYRPEEIATDRRRVLTATRPDGDPEKPLVAWCSSCQLQRNGPAYRLLRVQYRWKRRQDYGQLPLLEVAPAGGGCHV